MITRLFDENLQMTEEGIIISQKWNKVVEEFFDELDTDFIPDFNPIELGWILNLEVSLKIHGKYLDLCSELGLYEKEDL